MSDRSRRAGWPLALLLTAALGGAAAGAASADTGVVDASGGATGAQTEQTIAVDPADPRNILIGYISGLSVSHDGGRHWRVSPQSCSGDNNPAFDASGVAYFSCNNGSVALYTSLDAGDSWLSLPAPVSATDNNGDLVDRPWLVRGPGRHGLVLGWESFFTNPLGWAYLKTSRDGGSSWSPAFRVDDGVAQPAQNDPRQLPVMAPDGTIYDVYASGRQPFVVPQELPISFVVARVAPGGTRRVVAAEGVVRSSSPTEETEAISSLAAGPHGRLALAWADERGGASRILVVTSADGGRSWRAPVDVAGDDPALRAEHDHVQLGFTPDGRLVILWRDHRCCGGGWSSPYQLFLRVAAWGPTGRLRLGRELPVTSHAQQPSSSTSLDEYLALHVGPEGVSVAWNQPRNGTATTYFRRLPLSELPAVR